MNKAHPLCPLQFNKHHRLSFILMLLATAMMLLQSGCASRAALTSQTVPDGFELTIARYDTQGKHTYMTLNPTGQLAFAGGRAASLRQAKPILTLTAPQRQQVWQLIIQSNMLDTHSQSFKSPQTVSYDVTIDPGKGYRSTSFRTVDQAVPPAVVELHDTLFNWQANVNYHVSTGRQPSPANPPQP